MQRLFAVAAAILVTFVIAPAAQAQEGLSESDASDVAAQQKLYGVLEQVFSAMETARLQGDCDRVAELNGARVFVTLYSASTLPQEEVTRLLARFDELSRRPCEPREAPGDPQAVSVESVLDDLAPAVMEGVRFDPENNIAQMTSLHDACARGAMPAGSDAFFKDRYGRFYRAIQQDRDRLRQAAAGAEGATRHILIERAQRYDDALQGMPLPVDFQCGTTVAASDSGEATVAAHGLDWLVGVWRAPRHGGAIGFRIEPDGTASAYVAEVNDRMRENGYSQGQVFLRGCRDVTSDNLAVWRNSARCAESFRDRWQGESIVEIPRGREALELPSYYGDPLVDLEPLSRTGR